jgi:parallel beta-helix repeat protein
MALDVGSGNVVIQNTSRSNGGIGIVLTSMTDSLVANNTVQDNRWSGIALFGDPSGNTYGNTVVDNTATGNEEGFFLIYAFRNTVRSNTSNLNRQKGFWLTDSGENIVESNTAVGNKDLADGIEMDRSHKNVFINNVVNRNFVGFKIYMSNENTFTGNICNANGAIGFWVIFSSSYNTFTHNVGRNNPEDDADEDSSSCIGNVWSNNNFGLTSLTTY